MSIHRRGFMLGAAATAVAPLGVAVSPIYAGSETGQPKKAEPEEEISAPEDLMR